MNTSNPRHHLVSRDQVLVAHAADMIARTGFSQDHFAQALSEHLHGLVPAKAIAKDVPDFQIIAQGNDSEAFLKASGAWLRRVGRWLSGEVDLPSWIEEAWVEALEDDFQERCINELASRHGLSGARALAGDANPVGVFGQLVARMGRTVTLGSEILEDGRIDAGDLEKLPEFVESLRSAEARCSELRTRAEEIMRTQPRLKAVGDQVTPGL
ncbi:hypothetical protein DCO48_05775 [Pseudomonas sp. SDI]|uniref:hypothetical protein n=1 Tax=Pseudomonas sp. SDI TaxID=2170734 RepID=UPI000DE61DB5|nr:hypothetical protein [Pseudomonas sp. SDI]PWB34651.1 hypothetical protein DCO48_05775 [Pseudomonas sp. SDI]